MYVFLLLQIEPKIIFSVEAVSYNMKTHDHLAKLRYAALRYINSKDRLKMRRKWLSLCSGP